MEEFEELQKPITRRVIGFTSENFGYVALGTDWSMGSGEMKKIYFTYDGGLSWEEIKAPLNSSSSTLIDMNMYDKNNGVIVLSNSQDENMPDIYGTYDGGKNFQKIEFSYFNLPDEITYLTDVDSITFDGNDYYICMGQGSNGTLKATFKATGICYPWEFVSTKRENIHTVG